MSRVDGGPVRRVAERRSGIWRETDVDDHVPGGVGSEVPRAYVDVVTAALNYVAGQAGMFGMNTLSSCGRTTMSEKSV